MVTVTTPCVSSNLYKDVYMMKNIFENYPDIVSVDDIMSMLGIGKSSVYGLLKSNLIKHVRVGKKYIIPKLAVIDFINGACYNDTG